MCCCCCRLLGRQHQSCEDLTQLMKMEIRREELIRDKVLDVHTYRLLVTPPPTPVEEPGEGCLLCVCVCVWGEWWWWCVYVHLCMRVCVVVCVCVQILPMRCIT